MNTYRKIIGLSIAVGTALAFGLPVYATDCAASGSLSQAGNVFTVAQSCTFTNLVDGVDAGSGTSNTAVLKTQTGKTLTIQDAAQTVAVGSIDLTSGGSINLPTPNTHGAKIVTGTPLWAPDTDGDGYIDGSKVAQASSPGGTSIRANVAPNQFQPDCYAGSALYNQVITGNAPIAHWRLDEASGIIATDSAGANRAAAQGTTITANSAPNQLGTGSTVVVGDNARTFNGTSDYMTVYTPDATTFDFDRATPFTVAAWVKTSSATQQSIFSKELSTGTYRGFDFDIVATGAARLILVSDASTNNRIDAMTTTSVADGNWHHIEATYDGSSNAVGIKIYVDGVLKPVSYPMNALTATAVTHATDPNIGTRTNGITLFNGSIDDVRVYNYVRSSTQVTEDYYKYAPSIPLYSGDTDGDGYGGSTSVTTCGLQAGYAPKGNDVSEGNANLFQTASVATDADGDRYTTGSPASTNVGYARYNTNNGYLYYMNSAGNFAYLPSGSQLATADCDDTQANVFSTHAACYWDLDLDSYTAGNTSGKTCLNNTTCATSTYGSVGGGVAPTAYSSGQLKDAANGSDCNDSSAYVYQTQTVGTDVDRDAIIAEAATSSQCVGASTSVAASRNGTSLGNLTYYNDTSNTYKYLTSGSVAGYSDCNDTGTGNNSQYVWLSATCYVDTDNDLYPRALNNCNTGVGCYGSCTANMYYACTNNATCNVATWASGGNTSTGNTAQSYTATQLRTSAELKTSPTTDCNDANAGVF